MAPPQIREVCKCSKYTALRFARSLYLTTAVPSQQKPSHWYAGTALLVLRLVQTSFMALVRTQREQAAIMCCVTLVSATVQRELSPYRRSSDNHVAYLTHMLVLLWVRAMQFPYKHVPES